MNVFITGGTGVLGTAVTRAFLGRGDHVAATWIVEHEAERLEREVGATENLTTVQANVLDPDSLQAAVGAVRERIGGVDALVHLVGAWSGGKSVHEHDLDTWRRMLDLNLTSAFLACRAVLPHMLDRNAGRIVLVSSRTAIRDRSGQVAYAVAKAGLSVLAETISEETRGTDVTANVVAPSTLDTSANRSSMPGADHSRWVTPEDLAATITFLASEGATPLRGAWLPAFGGV